MPVPRLFGGWCLSPWVLPARYSRRGLVSSLSIVRGAGANGIRLTCAKTRRGRSTCPPASFLYRSRGRGEWHLPHVCRGWEGWIYVSARFLYSITRGVGANGLCPTCAETRRGRSTCPPASFILHRSWGKGESHSPHVYRGWEGRIYVSARFLPLSAVG